MQRCPTCDRAFVDGYPSCPLDGARLVADARAPASGLGRELGPYRLVGVLGEGGMGTIFIGVHAQLGRLVAIKVLRPELLGRPDAVARFFHEAHTINRLRHPNIIESLDLVEDPIDGAYCVLELLRGPDLKARLHAGALPIDSVLHIGTQLADALGAVHAIGIVHRDLKPENLILVEDDGRDDVVKLIDFGVAQIGQDAGAKVIGTAAYMAPEQASGRPVDGRADVYALGVMLFEMVTGRHPFPSNTDAEYLVHHASTRPPRPTRHAPHCPPALEAVILRCLAKLPADRFASAADVAALLRQIDPRARPRRGRAGLIATALVLAAAGGAAAYFLPDYLARGSAPKPAVEVVATGPAVIHEPAPEDASEVPPPPAEESTVFVEIEVISKPTGARVFRVGETIPLGVTPFSVPLARSDQPTQLRFELDGHESKQIEVPITDSIEIEVALVKDRAAGKAKSTVTFRRPKKTPTPAQPKARPLAREGVIDPFAP
jgi:hypothetical protein